jgi:hypothetical protein
MMTPIESGAQKRVYRGSITVAYQAIVEVLRIRLSGPMESSHMGLNGSVGQSRASQMAEIVKAAVAKADG